MARVALDEPNLTSDTASFISSDTGGGLLEDVWGWLKDLDYGTVPAWLTGFSLLLAFQIFLRDRRSADRSQVDQIGVWLKLEYERVAPEGARVENGKFTRFVRNGSALPVEIVQIAFDIHTRWMVRDLAQWRDELPVWDVKPGTGVVQMYSGRVRVAPEETWDSGPQEVNFAHLAPEHADQLDLIEGLSYEIRWVLMVDNAGRRWEMRPMVGGAARRIRWWSRRRHDYPVEWKNKVTYGLAVQYHKLRGGMQALIQKATSKGS
ncbi:MAG TPA: hypothetical protein VJ836_01040 [Candidatus Saccharimonadales bacterium]|nr:hypothetical protein [Candidatus Saccharimonadales bacterium]